MLKIRLMRIGAKKRPFYRVVVVDERAKRTGGYIDLIGTYNPLTNPKDIKIDQKKLEEWIKKGAQKSDGLLRILKEAPQRPPRKAKKEKKTSAPIESKTAETAQVTETPSLPDEQGEPVSPTSEEQSEPNAEATETPDTKSAKSEEPETEKP